MLEFDDGEWQQDLETYLSDDFAGYVNSVQQRLKQKPDNIYLYLFVISLQRLDRVDILAELIPHLLAVPDRQAASIVHLLAGTMTREQVLAAAATPHWRCQAHYYAASRFMTLGRLEDAQEAFHACLQITVDEGVVSRETLCAMVECRRRGWPIPKS